MNLSVSRTLAALFAVLALGLGAASTMADEAPKLMLKPDLNEHDELLPDRLPRMGFYSQFVYGRGAYVTGVVYGSEAARLGLEDGDVVVGVNGQRLNGPGDWNNILRDVVYNNLHDDVLLYGAQQTGGMKVKLQPVLKPHYDQIITLHIRDWRTGQIMIRKTNLARWN